jgi:2-polyprenyl-3-methyl-5-hydroxy-6-metoxy-1,4-benzoquinol methylase
MENDFQNLDYYSHVRRDILKHVPISAKCILSVGCGAGSTEALLVERGCEVFGIEKNFHAAELAKQRGIQVYCADATSDLPSTIKSKQYDCIIFADVLEHLVSPVSTLFNYLENLRVGGVVVISVPNYRNYEAFFRLFVAGDFGADEAGIFDKTHLHVTTKRRVIAWLDETNLVGITVDLVAYRRRDKFLLALLPRLLGEFIARQVIVSAQKN